MIKFLNKNKKDILILFSIFYFLFSLSFLPLVSFAACDRSQTPVCSIADVLKILNNIVGWMYTIFFVVAAIFILLAAYNFLFAQADPEKITKSKKQVLYAVIAIIIALLSVTFRVFIEKFLESGGQ